MGEMLIVVLAGFVIGQRLINSLAMATEEFRPGKMVVRGAVFGVKLAYRAVKLVARVTASAMNKLVDVMVADNAKPVRV